MKNTTVKRTTAILLAFIMLIPALGMLPLPVWAADSSSGVISYYSEDFSSYSNSIGENTSIGTSPISGAVYAQDPEDSSNTALQVPFTGTATGWLMPNSAVPYVAEGKIVVRQNVYISEDAVGRNQAQLRRYINTTSTSSGTVAYATLYILEAQSGKIWINGGYTSAVTALTKGAWNLIEVVIEQDGGAMTLYVNHEEVMNDTLTKATEDSQISVAKDHWIMANPVSGNTNAGFLLFDDLSISNSLAPVPAPPTEFYSQNFNAYADQIGQMAVIDSSPTTAAIFEKDPYCANNTVLKFPLDSPNIIGDDWRVGMLEASYVGYDQAQAVFSFDLWHSKDANGRITGQLREYYLDGTRKIYGALYIYEPQHGRIAIGGTQADISRVQPTLKVEEWNHVDLQIDLLTGNMALYVNDALVDEGNLGGINIRIPANAWIPTKVPNIATDDFAGYIMLDNYTVSNYLNDHTTDLISVDPENLLYIKLEDSKIYSSTFRVIKDTSYEAVYLHPENYTDLLLTESANSIRLSDDAGLRFATRLDTALFDELRALRESGEVVSIEFGHIIAPADYLSGEFTHADMKNAGKKYLEVLAYEDRYYSFDNDPATTHFVGSIVNLYESNVVRPFVGRGFVALTLKSGTTTYLYSSHTQERDVQTVAKAALDAGGNYTADQITILETFAAGKSPTTSTEPLALSYADVCDRLSNLQSLAQAPQRGEGSYEYTSYDRSSYYNAATDDYMGWDKNSDASGYIRKTDDGTGLVIAEMEGPGYINRFWATSDVLTNSAQIKIYIDGSNTPIMDLPFVDLFNSTEVFAQYGNLAYLDNKVYDCYVPITYNQSCRVELHGTEAGTYYHVGYTSLPEYVTLDTFVFPLNDAEKEALQAVNDALGTKKEAGEMTSYTVEPGAAVALYDTTSSGAVTELLMKVLHNTSAEYISHLRNLNLKIYWDGADYAAVDVSVGDFFNNPTGADKSEGYPMGTTAEGIMYSNWYMPFANGARIVLVNQGSSAIEIECSVATVTLPKEETKDLMRFMCAWNLESTDGMIVPDTLYKEIIGTGRLVAITMHNYNYADGFWWGEGDEKFFIDGEAFPSWYGTGSEDYFGYSYCNSMLFSKPYHTQSVVGEKDDAAYAEDPESNSRYAGNKVLARYHISDSITFTQSLKVIFEKFHLGSESPTHSTLASAIQSACVYYYVCPEQVVDNVEEPYDVNARNKYFPLSETPMLEPEISTGGCSAAPMASVQRTNSGSAYTNIVDGILTNNADTYDGTLQTEAWFGVTYSAKTWIDRFVYVNGNKFSDGGWFSEAPVVQVLINGVWTTVETTISEAYDTTGATVAYKEYVFTLKNAVQCTGIRLYGTPGGNGIRSFISCAELYALYEGAPVVKEAEKTTQAELAENRWSFTSEDPVAVQHFTGNTVTAIDSCNAFMKITFAAIGTGDVTFTVGGSSYLYTPDAIGTQTAIIGPVSLAAGENTITVSSGEIASIDMVITQVGTTYDSADFFTIATDEFYIQNMSSFGSSWTKKIQILFDKATPESQMRQTINITDDGCYAIGMYFTEDANFGIYNIYVDGVLCVQGYDLYAASLTYGDYILLGVFELSAGEHELLYVCTGKNESSTGYLVGIDSIVIDRLDTEEPGS